MLFYYLGHSVQFENDNYLIPVDTEFYEEYDVTTYGYSLSEVAGALTDNNKKRANIIILDSSTTNPLGAEVPPSQLGLVELKAGSLPPNAFIAYASHPRYCRNRSGFIYPHADSANAESVAADRALVQKHASRSDQSNAKPASALAVFHISVRCHDCQRCSCKPCGRTK